MASVTQSKSVERRTAEGLAPPSRYRADCSSRGPQVNLNEEERFDMTITARPQDVSIGEQRLRDLLGRISPGANCWDVLAVLMSLERRLEQRGSENLEDTTWEDATFY